MPFSRPALRAACALLATGLSVLAVGASPALAQPGPSADATAAVPGTNDKGGAGQGPSAPLNVQSAPGSGASLLAAAPTVTRSEVISRANGWFNQGLVYSWNGTHQGYRTDCSGYASMAWKLSTPGLDTTSFVPSGVASWLGSKNDLKPGDALLNDAAGAAGHIVIFDQWADTSHNSYVGYEFTGSGVKHRTIPYPYFSNFGTYKPVRNNSVVDDPTGPSVRPTAAGVFQDGTWALRNAAGATTNVGFGNTGDTPITGDWDGVGHDQIGVFRPSTNTFALRHDNGTSDSLTFGDPGDKPVPGMWDHNGHAQMAVYRPSTNTFIVRHDNGTVDSVVFGDPGDIPIVGDWDGVGHTQMGIFRPAANSSEQNIFALRHDDGSVSTVTYGNPGDLPVVGDWAGKGRTTYGIYRPSTGDFALSNAYNGTPDTTFRYGNPNWTPTTGNWS
ncbi:hypothetical protein [Kitasatospora sp. NPDC088351]|uniref:hypothetical protein n=1 Tax=unclassified Kitasatospora TaxID=2633591 RepID=UPI00342C8377